VKVRDPKQAAIVSMDGRLMCGGRATVSIDDWGFRYGWGAFETIRVSRRKPVFLSRHLDRLSNSARALLFAGKESDSRWWHDAIMRAMSRADWDEGVLNLYWTRGEAPLFRGRRIICLRPRLPRRRGEGRIWVAPWQISPGVPGIGVKTLAYLQYTFTNICALAADFTDAVMVNWHNRIADGALASVFLIRRGEVLTPPTSEGALPGITRGVVLELARKLGIEAHVTPLPIRRLYASDGVFMTSVLRGVRAVRQVNDRPITMTKDAKDVFARLAAAYRRAVDQDIAAFG
jgi:branched-chain amino acid aminotransferase